MKIKLLFLLLIISTKLFSQDYIFGKITDETQNPISGVEVINMRTEQSVFSDGEGNFMIAALENDEIRVIKKKFDRVQFRLKSADFHSILKVTIISSPELIEEVSIAFKPTGNLKRDLKKLPENKKLQRLEDAIAQSLNYKPTEVMPKLSIPSAFAPPDYSKGQLTLFDLSGGGIVGALVKIIKPKPKFTEPNYIETEAFLKKLKESIDRNYYYNYGLSDEQLEQFLAEANKQMKLARLYRKDFNLSKIEFLLRKKLETYNIMK